MLKKNVFFSKQNVLGMLYFCRDSYKNAPMSDPESFAEQMNKYIEKNKDLSVCVSFKNGGAINAEDIPEEGKLFLSSTYIETILGYILKYLKRLTIVDRLFPLLSFAVDFNRNNSGEAERIMECIEHLTMGKISENDLLRLSDYISDIPANNRRFWINLIGGSIIYWNVLIIMSLTFMRFFK